MDNGMQGVIQSTWSEDKDIITQGTEVILILQSATYPTLQCYTQVNDPCKIPPRESKSQPHGTISSSKSITSPSYRDRTRGSEMLKTISHVAQLVRPRGQAPKGSLALHLFPTPGSASRWAKASMRQDRWKVQVTHLATQSSNIEEQSQHRRSE
jgi:hypothetical protein